MSEPRFTIQKASGMYLHLPIFDNGVEMADGDVCILLNEQQVTIEKQDEEIRKLKKTERSWRKIHCCNKESNNCGIVIEQQNIISKLESDLQKIPPKIRELWIGEE